MADYALAEIIVESNDDLEIWSSIIVGFDDEKNLVVQLEYINYDDHEEDYVQKAVVDKMGAFLLAQQLRVALTDLPSALQKRFVVNHNAYVPSQVKTLFHEIVAFLRENRVVYVMK